MKDLAIAVGLAIRNKRKEQKISQEALASLADIDRSYMGRIERGEVNITLNMLSDISIALDVPLKTLIPD